jgi:hypothetical protein
METINDSLTTITLEHVFPHETIGDLTKRACLQGRIFKVSITVEEPYFEAQQVKSSHPLADYLDNNHPFSGLSEQINGVTNEIKEGMNDRLFNQVSGRKIGGIKHCTTQSVEEGIPKQSLGTRNILDLTGF